MKLRVATGLALSTALVATSSAAPPTFHAAVAASSPQLWYKFDEPAGSTTVINYGSFGAAYNATVFNGVTLGAPTCEGDTGGTFNRLQQQYVESLTAAPASLTGNPSFTCEAVVRISSTTANAFYAPFLHWGAAATGRSVYFSLFRDVPDRGYVGFYNGGLRTVGTFTNNAYNHFVWVRDSAGGTNGQYVGSTLYINGQVVALEPDTTLPGAPTINVSSTTFRVQRATDLNRYFSGTVDEIVLYNRALTAEEVATHFTNFERPCPADLDRDGSIGLTDLATLLTQFGSANALCGDGDLDRDNDIDLIDLATLLTQFGTHCPG